MQRSGLQKTLQVLLILVLGTASIIYAKPFLVPICFAGILTMLFVPLSRKLESAGLNKGLSAFSCVLVFLLILAIIIGVIAWQFNNLVQDIGNIEGKIRELIEELKNFVSETFGWSKREQTEMLNKQSENASGMITKVMGSLLDIVVNFILVVVYVFLFLYFRTHIKKFIAKLIPKKEDENADDAIANIQKISQQYLTGLGLMIVCLWIMYSIGFSIVGLDNAFFFAILCGLFEIVPFVGNFIGNVLAGLMAITQGGGMPMVIGIVITYGIIQFIQTYFLEPLVVGTEVNINPLFTIMGLVLGELLWGIAGMVLAIPLIGIFKIICDHVDVLKPYGFLIGRQKSDKPTLVERIKERFGKR